MLRVTPRRIVALCGRKRVGKDTIADRLCDVHGFSSIKVSAALKAGIVAMFGFTPDQVEGDLKDVKDAHWDVEPRKVMQWLGTDIFQYHIEALIPGVGRTFWMSRVCQQIRGVSGDVVLSDVRFQHEIDCLRQLARADGHSFHVVRVERGACGTEDCHASEQCDMCADVVMTNDSTISALMALVDKFCVQL